MEKKERRLFEWEYIIRFGLICIIAVSVMVLVFNYKFTSNEIISLNESNEVQFLENFEELKLESDWGTYRDIEDIGQRKVSVVEIDRESYDISPRAFVKLPFIPYDWGKIKYAFDMGYYSILSRATEDYYLQPEFYDDWETVGMSFYGNPDKVCRAGFFSMPSGQRLYTRAGSTIDTFMLVHSSFCVGNKQGISFGAVYPSEGITDDGIEYKQDPGFVERFISLDFSPNDVVLGGTYPGFDMDWASKVTISVSVSDLAPRGIYVVAIDAALYEPFFIDKENINLEAYKSKGGSPLMYIVVAVD